MMTYSSETSVDFQRTTRSYIPEDGTLLAIIWFSVEVKESIILSKVEPRKEFKPFRISQGICFLS
jgi:hypothetical protein